LYAFISYLGRLNEPLIELTTQQSMLQQAVVAGERVFELMDCPRQTYGYDDEPLKSGAIEINDVSFAYRDDSLVLQDISLNVPPAALWPWWGIPAAVKARSQACSWAIIR
jgi:ATP-binding cassette subfamily B multidrug efflux pump